MKTWKRFGTGAVVAFGIAALSVCSITPAYAGGGSGVVRNGCTIFGTDFGDSCTMTESGVNCEGDQLGLPPDSCAFWQFQMRRGGDNVCVQDVDLSSHNPKLSLPIKADLTSSGEVSSDSVCVGGSTVGGGSSGGWVTIRTGNGNDDIHVGDCSCKGPDEVYGETNSSQAIGGTEVFGLTTIATGKGSDAVIVTGAYFHSPVSIRVGQGNDTVYLDDIDCDGTNLPIEVNCGTDGGYLCIGSGVDTSCGLFDDDCCDIINDNNTCTLGCI